MRARDARATLLDLVGTALLASLGIVGNRRYHAIGTIIAACLLTGFIIVETLRIA